MNDLLTTDAILDFIRPALAELPSDQLRTASASDWCNRLREQITLITLDRIADEDPLLQLQLAQLAATALATHARVMSPGQLSLSEIMSSADDLDLILRAAPLPEGELRVMLVDTAKRFRQLIPVTQMLRLAIDAGVTLDPAESVLLVSFAAAATRLLAAHRVYHLSHF